MNRFCKYLCGIVLAFAVTASAAWADAGWDVRPGDGVGPVSIGMPFSKCETFLKRDPKAEHVFLGRKKTQPFWVYYTNGVQVNYDRKGKAMQVWVDKPGIVTSKGVQVGDSKDKFIAAYGRGYDSHELPTAKNQPKIYAYYYKSSGLGFQIEGGIVKFIIVCQKHS